MFQLEKSVGLSWEVIALFQDFREAVKKMKSLSTTDTTLRVHLPGQFFVKSTSPLVKGWKC